MSEVVLICPHCQREIDMKPKFGRLWIYYERITDVAFFFIGTLIGIGMGKGII